jgi:hypothetical protein
MGVLVSVECRIKCFCLTIQKACRFFKKWRRFEGKTGEGPGRFVVGDQRRCALESRVRTARRTAEGDLCNIRMEKAAAESERTGAEEPG